MSVGAPERAPERPTKRVAEMPLGAQQLQQARPSIVGATAAQNDARGIVIVKVVAAPDSAIWTRRRSA
jgi:hypothetical protein